VLFTASSPGGSLHSLRRAEDTGDQVGRPPELRVAPAANSWHSEALAEHLGLVSHHDTLGQPSLHSCSAPRAIAPPAPSPTRLFLARYVPPLLCCAVQSPVPGARLQRPRLTLHLSSRFESPAPSSSHRRIAESRRPRPAAALYALVDGPHFTRSTCARRAPAHGTASHPHRSRSRKRETATTRPACCGRAPFGHTTHTTRVNDRRTSAPMSSTDRLAF
jgi:hypothetical protein